jgi:2-haloacid dehalogenase
MRPSVLVFDVNETLSDLSPLAARFVEVGASASGAALWFASVLRDGFALTAAGENPSFSAVARELITAQLSEVQLNRSVQDAAAHIMHGFAHLEMHPDVAPGLEALHEAGFRLVTLSNGAASVADQLFTAAGVRDHFERLMSVTDAGAWKPTPTAYQYAAKTCETEPGDMLMVAVHPWDIHGASRAGLQTAWVNRSAGPYPASFLKPTITVSGLEELAEVVS